MAIQRDNDASPNLSNDVLGRAESGNDLPRWLVILSAAAGFTLFVALLRYAIDLLGVVFVIILVGFAIRTLSDWLTEGESVSAWTVSALSLGLTGTVLVGLWLFNSRDLTRGKFEDALPGPIHGAVGWMEERGWGQRVLLPASAPTRTAGSDDRPFAGATAGATAGADTGAKGAAVRMAPPRVTSESASPPSRTSRARRVESRPERPGEAAAAPRPTDAAETSPPAPAAPARLPTTLSLRAPATSVVGRAVRLEAVVSSGHDARVPAGQVVFRAGSTTVGRSPLRRGVAILVTLSLEIGEHQLAAAYEGDEWHLPSESSRVAHSVRRQ